MAAAAHSLLITSAEALLCHPALQRLPPRPPLRDFAPVRPPRFSPPLQGFGSILQQLECSSEAAGALEAAYVTSCHQLAVRCETSYASSLAALRATFEADEGAHCAEWQQGLALAMERQYQQTADDMRNRLLDEVRSAQARHAASPIAAYEPQEPGQFTPDVLAILHAAFSAADHVSKAERRTLAAATALSERQILTWVRPSPSLLFVDGHRRTTS